jgi:molybdopterin converting factor small subunit
MIQVCIPPRLANEYRAAAREPLQASTIPDLVLALEERFPGIVEHLTETDPEPPHDRVFRRWVQFFVDGRVLGRSEVDVTVLPDGAVVAIVPEFTGG